ncbi:MAG: glycosyltransferase family 2 protein [Bacteroidota bacterium]|jgi:GT2 family glycosyltransferase
MYAENPVNQKMIDVSIVIINYELAREIENCLHSLLQVIKSTDTLSYEIIIVDNNSPNKDLKQVENKNQQENIHFYYLDNNLGFGKGCNYGFTKAKGRYICFLNPDTIIRENIFTRMIELLERDVSIGVSGPQQQVRSPFFDYSAGFSPNIIFEIAGLFGIGVFFEGFLIFLYTKFRKKEYLSVHWILGACIFITSELFRIIDGFDKDYFMFFEEVDLCKRVSNRGLRIAYVPSLAIHHVGSVSGKRDYYLYTIRTYSSKYIFISKHYLFLHKAIMRLMLYIQLFTQMGIWLLIFPLNKVKSKQKLKAFVYLLVNRMINKID